MSDRAIVSGASAAYQAARSGAMVVERTDRAQLRAHGRDPARMIQGLITNDIESADATRAVYAAMLTPKGRMVADMRLLRNADGSVLIDLDRAALAGMLEHVKKYVPPMFARFEAHEPPHAVIGVYGPGAAAVVRSSMSLDVAADAEELTVARSNDVFSIATREAGVPGFDLFLPRERTSSALEELVGAGALAGDEETLELLRIEAGRPRWGAELDPGRIPLEANLRDRAISTSKGCYTGQEVIIRILHRGHVNWHLRGVLLGAAAPPAAGAELATPEGRVVARVTSAARSPTLGQTIALAYVRREIEAGTQLRLPDGALATVVELPFTEGS